MAKIVSRIMDIRFSLYDARSLIHKVKRYILGKEVGTGLIFKLFLYLILIDVAFIYLNPILYMLSTMVKSNNDLLDPTVNWVPRELFFGHLKEAWKILDYTKSLSISVIISVSAAVLQVIFCSMAGYAFARMKFPFKTFWFICLLFTFIVPAQVTVLPMLLMYKKFEWLNTFYPMIVPALFGHGLKGALFVIIFRQFFSTLPKELEEAAKIDGAHAYKIFYRVMLPISLPAIVVVFLFSLVWNWNDSYFPSMFMFKAEDVPLSIGMSDLSSMMAAKAKDSGPSIFDDSLKMAASFLIILPPLLIYAFTQRWFVEGVERTGLVE